MSFDSDVSFWALRTVLFRLSILLLLSCLCGLAADVTCPITPFAVPLRNCTLDTDVVSSYGVLVEAGTPGQRLCLAPSTVVNSTLVSQQSLCPNPNMLRLCESLRGGFFNETQSTTWTDSSFGDYNSTRSEPTWEFFNPPGLTKVGYDTVFLPGADERVFEGYGLALNQKGYTSINGMLGLGIDSLFLDTAVKKNLTGSRGWSMDAGSQSEARPRNGEMVFGGYNQGKLDGSFRWDNVSDMSGGRPCPLRTTITDIYVTFENGTDVPLKSSAEQITACIEPYDHLFRFTPGMLQNWKHVTEFEEEMLSVYTPENTRNLTFAELGLPYNASKVPRWSLSISLDSGYTTTLPSHEMQMSSYGWDPLGNREVVPDVVNSAILQGATGAGEVPTLGRVFLSQSYLAVDYDQGRFGLARALLEPAPTKLVPFGCAQSAQVAPSSAGGSSEPGSSEPGKKSLGAIVGPAVGGGLALILLVVAIVFFVRRRRNKMKPTEIKAGTSSPPPTQTAYYPDSHITYPVTWESSQNGTGRVVAPIHEAESSQNRTGRVVPPIHEAP